MGNLTQIFGGTTLQLELPEGVTVQEILERIFEEYGEAAKKEIMDEKGKELAPYYKVLVDGRNFKLLSTFDTVIKDGQTVTIMPPIAGG
jgi:MoaD family protein